jgi:hypothetical protein
LKAGAYAATPHAAVRGIGFVSTNSITQGEQVAQLWPLLFDRYGLEIAFAHRTFAWGSDARGVAHVHVVIVGLARRDREPETKRLFTYDGINGDPSESRHPALTAYLFGAETVANRHLVVREEGRPLTGAPRLLSGSQPIENGHLIFDQHERAAFLLEEPGAEPYLRPFVGTEEYLYSIPRWILALQSVSPMTLRGLPLSVERLRAVKTFRSKSTRSSTRAIADFPERYNVQVLPTRPFLAVPEVSSERREYIPIGWLKPPTIPSNKLRLLPDATLWHFAVLTSAMHMSWLRHIGGRLKSDYQYGIGVVYNTLPWPEVTEPASERVERLAQTVLDARAEHPEATLADLYDPDLMPANLRKAHRSLDVAVDRLYRPSPFGSDQERVEYLFGLYEQVVAGFLATPAKAKRRPRARAGAD